MEHSEDTLWEQSWIKHEYFLKAQINIWRLLMHHWGPKEWPVNIRWVLKSVRLCKTLLGNYVMTLMNWSSGRKWWIPFLWTCISQKPLIPWNFSWWFPDALMSSFKWHHFWSCLSCFPWCSSKENWVYAEDSHWGFGWVPFFYLLLLLFMAGLEWWLLIKFKGKSLIFLNRGFWGKNLTTLWFGVIKPSSLKKSPLSRSTVWKLKGGQGRGRAGRMLLPK